MTSSPDVAVRAPLTSEADYLGEARSWLASMLPAAPSDRAWGIGDDSAEVFPDLDGPDQRRMIEDRRSYEQAKYDAGYGEAMTWPAEYGGADLPLRYKLLFEAEEQRFAAPAWTELFGVTQALVAPTILEWGTPEQRDRFIRPLLRTDMLACQLFSEPDAGSDLANVRTSARRDGDSWVIAGTKVWTSGATSADYGEAICLTDHAGARHRNLTAFLVPLTAPGVEVNPIRQMTGGSSFNEVVLNDVRVTDDLRLGPVGSGWGVALTTLGAERAVSGAAPRSKLERLRGLLMAHGLNELPVVRAAFVDLYVHIVTQDLLERRVSAAVLAGEAPGPEGSIGKLLAALNGMRITEFASLALGPRLIADTGEWGTYAWAQHVLGAPALRIAGGSDEVQRNIIGERVLGLPREPRP